MASESPVPATRISDLARVDARPADYLEGLNPEQREAVEAVEGPVLVLAGAGTGKTRVLTTRLAHILATGRARPWELLAVTFTNKAAREMRTRITDIIGPSAEGLRWLGTFHSIAAQILRRHAELVGLKSSYTIIDARVRAGQRFSSTPSASINCFISRSWSSVSRIVKLDFSPASSA